MLVGMSRSGNETHRCRFRGSRTLLGLPHKGISWVSPERDRRLDARSVRASGMSPSDGDCPGLAGLGSAKSLSLIGMTCAIELWVDASFAHAAQWPQSQRFRVRGIGALSSSSSSVGAVTEHLRLALIGVATPRAGVANEAPEHPVIGALQLAGVFKGNCLMGV